MTQFKNTIEILAQMIRDEQDMVDHHREHHGNLPEMQKYITATEARIAEYKAAIKVLQEAGTNPVNVGTRGDNPGGNEMSNDYTQDELALIEQDLVQQHRILTVEANLADFAKVTDETGRSRWVTGDSAELLAYCPGLQITPAKPEDAKQIAKALRWNGLAYREAW